MVNNQLINYVHQLNKLFYKKHINPLHVIYTNLFGFK